MTEFIYPLIALIIFVFIVFLLLRILKKVIEVVLSLFFILFFISAILGYFVYADIKDIEQNFANSTNLYLIEDNGQIVYGFRAKGFGLLEKDLLTQEELSTAQQNYDQENYKEMLQDNYKILIFKKALFGDTDKEDLPDAFDEAVEEEGPAFIYKEFKNGNVIIYPKTAFFKTLKFIPGFIAERMRMFN